MVQLGYLIPGARPSRQRAVVEINGCGSACLDDEDEHDAMGAAAV